MFSTAATLCCDQTSVWFLLKTGIWRVGRRACALAYAEYRLVLEAQTTDVESR